MAYLGGVPAVIDLANDMNPIVSRTGTISLGASTKGEDRSSPHTALLARQVSGPFRPYANAALS